MPAMVTPSTWDTSGLSLVAPTKIANLIITFRRKYKLMFPLCVAHRIISNWLQVGIEFGRQTIQHSEELRFRLALLYAPRSSRWYVPDLVGWCHRSTGRKLAGLGSKPENRNDALDSVCLSYRVVR